MADYPLAVVVHACNPTSYSRGSDRYFWSLRKALAKLWRHHLKNKIKTKELES
jgi:hypothetical protein